MFKTTRWLFTSFIVLAIALLAMGCSDGSDRTPPPYITALNVEPPLAILDVGSSEFFRAIATYSDGTLTEVSSLVSWSLEIDNGTVEERPGGGSRYEVLALMGGEEGIVARFDSHSAKATVVVVEAQLVELRLSPRAADLLEGQQISFTAEGTYDDGHQQDLTEESDWTSNDSSVASIDDMGLAMAESKGTTTISASIDGLSESAIVEVHEKVELERIEVTPPDAIMYIDGSLQFSARAFYSDGKEQNITRSALWTSSDTGVVAQAPYDKGLFNSISVGSAVITAEYGLGNKATSSVTVEEVVITHIITTPKDAKVEVGATRRFYTEAQTSDGRQFSTNHRSGQVYTVADPEIAYISNYEGDKGKLTARSQGTTIVTSNFTSEDGEEFTDQVTVTVCEGDSC